MCGVCSCFSNSGQLCNVLMCMLVYVDYLVWVEQVVCWEVECIVVGDLCLMEIGIGLVVSCMQFECIQYFIWFGIEEGVMFVVGGFGWLEGFVDGFYVWLMVFLNVMLGMMIVMEEIFGLVLLIMIYWIEDEVVVFVNDLVYGFVVYVQLKDFECVCWIVVWLCVGNVYINYLVWNLVVLFGGYKCLGNGCEYVEFGFVEYLEMKGMIGYMEGDV